MNITPNCGAPIVQLHITWVHMTTVHHKYCFYYTAFKDLKFPDTHIDYDRFYTDWQMLHITLPYYLHLTVIIYTSTTEPLHTFCPLHFLSLRLSIPNGGLQKETIFFCLQLSPSSPLRWIEESISLVLSLFPSWEL